MERLRLSSGPETLSQWRRWGPYLADRAWGTVREDYSRTGDAWNYLSHDLARSKAFRWGEDGIAGWSDRYQMLCWSLALWNERDPILKERLFGLIPAEGNHGEDVKECYFYVDALPSHAWQRMLYKYPQQAYPYELLIEENRKRGEGEPEFELLDTGIFDGDRYFDVEIDIAKDTPDDIYFRVTAHNRGPDPAPLHLVPQLWFRNIWGWSETRGATPTITALDLPGGSALLADDSSAAPLDGLLGSPRVGALRFDFSEGGELLFTDNETNAARVWGPGSVSASPHTKDAFHRWIVSAEAGATSPERRGTKAAVRWRFVVPPGGSATIRMRLAPLSGREEETPERALAKVDSVMKVRSREADEFYDSVHPPAASEEERRIQRQALSGLLWSKQVYLFDVAEWLDGDRPGSPPPAERKRGRNAHWRHLNSMRVMVMPDKWEYPWFAAWDLAFEAIPLALVDPELAKEQLWLLLFEQFQHPNGQIPAYEWEFSDLNPPVHAWAIWRVYTLDRLRSGRPDRIFLERCFHKLLLNFTWWVNKVDREGNNVFEGGFLGLDNIALFDRSSALRGGAVLEQSDGTGWMGMFCLVMMRIALELAKEDPVYEGLATKFFEHYVYIGAAMKMRHEGQTLWNEEDGFFYDILRWPDGSSTPFRVRSLVGLIPLYAIERLEANWIRPFAVFRENLEWFLRFRKDIVERCVTTVEEDDDVTHVLAVVDQQQLQRLLSRVVDPQEFLSDYGLRSLSRIHRAHPFRFDSSEVGYEPAESREKIKGGNSNWRGPVWAPTTFLMIESLRKLEKAFGGTVRVTTTDPDTGEKETLTLSGIALDLADRLIGTFLPDSRGYRPLYGPPGTRKSERFARDPHWRKLILFHEYFNGDSGEGLGASHQTGWTALVASLIDEWRR